MTDLLRSFDYVFPTEIRYGENIVAELPHRIKRDGISSVLLITDPGLKDMPFTRKILDVLKNGGVRCAVYGGVEANPKDHNVQSAAALAREKGAEALIALGGGSPMDCAKAVAILAPQGGEVRDYEDSSRIGEKILPLYTVPTTAGTGSEVTFSAVITDSRAKFKFTVKSPRIAPRAAFIDPQLSVSMPSALTAATGMDALTHAIEAFTARNANPISDAAALHAVDLIDSFLVRAVKTPEDMEARAGMMLGSLIAGIAFSHSDVASVHCLAEALGGMYDSPHGVCNAVALPVVMEYNLEYALDLYARIARVMGIAFESSEEGARRAVERVKFLAVEVGLPRFSELGIRESDFPVLAEKSAQNGSNRDNPRPMKSEDYLELLKILQRG
ncbi:iron-containing alcohol dehydrogenase [Marispirochaeta aestuarii]|uniref:iron-containing alcohol dehydrogenase n=1 Tax=Marispirochaeta aestuarii TaxID=1963862 RepID=UPI0029C856AE|nr:iron-containing alcohol dehydrogenase [Marispirochaeta aestuarii]